MAKRKRQSYIPGTEPPSIPAIDSAAETYMEARDERCRLSTQEHEAHDNLLEVMKENGLDRYEFDGFIVVALSKTKCLVKKKKEAAEIGGEG